MARLFILLEMLLPVFIWGSLGLWGFSVRAAVKDDREGLELNRSLFLQAIACGPLAFLVDWRRYARREQIRQRKYGGGRLGEGKERSGAEPAGSEDRPASGDRRTPD